MDEFVKIRLFNTAGVRVLAITDRTGNNGLFRDWSIPATVPPGDYTIRVKTLDDAVSDDSGVFSIGRPRLDETPEINITSPISTNRWNRGSTKTISWTTVGTMDTRVKIHLMNEAGTSEVLTVIANTPQDGSHPWPIPGTQSAGRYRVRVQTLDNRVTRNSAIFNITALPTIPLPEHNMMESSARLHENTQPVIRVIYPNGGEVLERSGRCEIRWEAVDGFNPPRIKIQKGGRTVKEYPPSRISWLRTRAGYSWTWMIPGDLTPGSDYKVRIEKGDFSRSNDLSNNNFTISSDLNIEVVEPRGGGLVATNGKIIRWRVGGVSSNLNVRLHNTDRGGSYPIRSNIGVTPSRFLWYVADVVSPTSLVIQSRDHYKIVITATDRSATGESNVFQIVKPTLEVISPNGGEKARGDTLNIRWNNSPGFHGNVKITLQKYGGHLWSDYHVLFADTRDRGVSWRIWPRPGAGEGEIDPIPVDTYYRIKVESIRCPKEVMAFGERFMLRYR